MSEISSIAPAFVNMAHRIVWATVATVDPQGRPRARILHPHWRWDGTALTGWIATSPTPIKGRRRGRRLTRSAGRQAAVVERLPSRSRRNGGSVGGG